MSNHHHYSAAELAEDEFTTRDALKLGLGVAAGTLGLAVYLGLMMFGGTLGAAILGGAL